MNTAELLAVFREEVADTELPYLWSDASVYRYIDDAQKQFCRWTYGIADARSFKLSVKPGTEWYALDPRILKIRSAVRTDGRLLPVVALEKLTEYGIRFDRTPGPVSALVTGMQENALRAWPLPNAATTVELRVFRLPEATTAGGDLEIGEQHHLDLLLWVKYRAYSVQDSEASDKRKAAEFYGLFQDYCAAAKTEQGRLNRPVSTVSYGGI